MPDDRRAQRRASRTTPVLDGDPAPRLPHERDESSDSQRSGPRDVMRQAHDDLERGLVDTDRGPPLDATYRRTQREADAGTPPSAGTPQTGPPARPASPPSRSADASKTRDRGRDR